VSADPAEAASRAWFVYVLVCAAGRTYTGVTNDLDRRLEQHNGLLPGGAKATRAYRPWRYGRTWGPYAERGAAQAVEHRVKQLRGAARLAWTPPG
jgi:putative endonuclease